MAIASPGPSTPPAGPFPDLAGHTLEQLEAHFGRLLEIREAVVLTPSVGLALDIALAVIYQAICRLSVQAPPDVPPGLAEAEERALWGDR